MRQEKENLSGNLGRVEQMRMLDMHAHLSCLETEHKKRLSKVEQLEAGRLELQLRRQQSIATFFSCGTPEEWVFLEQLLQSKRESEQQEAEKRGFTPYNGSTLWKSSGIQQNSCGILRSFGIHPWYSDRYDPQEYYDRCKPVKTVNTIDNENAAQVCFDPFLQCDAVGEIGMDSVWCSVPLDIQQNCFVKQLDIAAEQKKPVILHTKGQEARIAELIRDFPEKICVHWYSGDEKGLEKFLESDCYFTLGPDVSLLHQGMLQQIPADRLFLESDGADAVRWALGKRLKYWIQEKAAADLSFDQQFQEKEENVLTILSALFEHNLQQAAEQKNMTAEALRKQMWKNLGEFLGVAFPVLINW